MANKCSWFFLIKQIAFGIFCSSCSILTAISSAHDIANAEVRLRAADLETGRIANLHGRWQFYHQRFMAESDFLPPRLPTSDGLIDVPSTWNNFKISDKPIGGLTWGTYEILLHTEGVKAQLALEIHYAGTAYRVFANGIEICHNGTPGISAGASIPEYRSVICRFKPEPTTRILIHVSNFHHAEGGLWDVIAFGTARDIENSYRREFIGRIFELGGLTAMSFFMIAAYLLRRRDRKPLYFGLFNIVISARLLTEDIRLMRELASSLSWEWHACSGLLTVTLASIFVTKYFSSFVESKKLKIIANALVLYFAVWTIILCTTKAIFFTDYYRIILYSIFVTIAVNLLHLIFMIRQRVPYYPAYILGSTILFITVILSTLYKLGYFYWYDVSVFGQFVFVAIQCVLVALALGKLIAERGQLLTSIRDEISTAERFVPRQHIRHLGKTNFSQLSPGDLYRTEKCIVFLSIIPQFSEPTSLENLREMIADITEQVLTHVRSHGGVVDQMLPNVMTILFEANAAAALRCMIDIRKDFLQIEEHTGIKYEMQAGLHKGEIAWGIIGDDTRLSGTMLSDAVNLAARIKSLCSRYKAQILISQDVYFSLEDPTAFQIRMLDAVTVKGRNESTYIFQCLEGMDALKLAGYLDTMDQFGRGVDAFVNRKFALAASHFAMVRITNPADYGAQLYYERSRILTVNPEMSEGEWNPVLALTEK